MEHSAARIRDSISKGERLWLEAYVSAEARLPAIFTPADAQALADAADAMWQIRRSKIAGKELRSGETPEGGLLSAVKSHFPAGERDKLDRGRTELVRLAKGGKPPAAAALATFFVHLLDAAPEKKPLVGESSEG